mgnify:CR=1 FL=1
MTISKRSIKPVIKREQWGIDMEIDGITLHDLHIEDLQDPLHSSSYEEHDLYHLLILLLPEKLKRRPLVCSCGFIITDTAVYHYDPERQELVAISGGMYGMYQMLDEKIDPIMGDIEKVTDKIAALEESLYKKVSFAFMAVSYTHLTLPTKRIV